MALLPTLERFFDHQAGLRAGERLLVAFSGGPDSTALLWGLSRLGERRRWQVRAAHLDHGLDPGSRNRAREASELAASLGIPIHLDRRKVPTLRHPGESLEGAARRVRYLFLEQVRRELGARFIATAHHRDDQIETVLLRFLFGSGIEGLGAMSPVRGTILRPVLSLPARELALAARSAGLEPVSDPTNEDLRRPRNLVRHRLLPSLAGRHPKLADRLDALAEAVRGARARIRGILETNLVCESVPGGVAVGRRKLAALPPELLPFALSLLHFRAGAPYPPRRAARFELARQLAAGKRIGCDGGDGWRWESRRLSGGIEAVAVVRSPAPEGTTPSPFAYTFEVPGEIEIPELSLRFRLRRGAPEPWMRQGDKSRAGLALPLAEGQRVTIRNRRPGDRLRPLGLAGRRRLKEVLIDHRVPRPQRDRIPILCVADRIAWVPGVTIENDFRLSNDREAWVAEILPAHDGSTPP